MMPISSQPTIPSPTLPVIAWLSVIAIGVLLILLVEKQRVVGVPGGRARKFNRVLTITILPLLVALAVSVLVELAASISQDSSQPAVPSPTSVPRRGGVRLAVLQATKPVATPTHIPRRIVPSAPQPLPRAATVLVNPRELRFGNQRLHMAGAAQTVYVVNLGPTSLRITGVTIAGGHDVSDFAESNVCAGATIPAYDGCTISVSFRPISSGTHSARLIIDSNAAGSPQRVALSGFGSRGVPGRGSRAHPLP